MARFDWYQASVPAEVGPLRGALSDLVAVPSWQELAKVPQGYGSGARLSDGDGAVALVWWGGMHDRPHVVASGETAPLVADLLRGQFPGHAVTRADACIDYAEPGAYDRLQGIALDVAKDRNVKVGTAGDHLLTKEGRTLYLGAPSSHTRLRLYDKAAELRDKFKHDPAKLCALPSELARLECQVRPQTREAKLAAAVADPVSLMGSALWMRVLMGLVAGLDLAPFQAGRVWRQADDDRAYAALLAQYGGLLARVCGDLGSWDMVGRQIGHDLAERERFARVTGGGRRRRAS